MYQPSGGQTQPGPVLTSGQVRVSHMARGGWQWYPQEVNATSVRNLEHRDNNETSTTSQGRESENANDLID